MGIPYQANNCKRIIFTVGFIFLCWLNIGQAKAYDSLFVVDGVKVDVTAGNSVTAQNKAFDEAQNKAFRILAQRMVAKAQAESVSTPNALTIASLVKDYEITEEQLSSVRYVGTYTFRFREAAVSKFFSVSGVTFTNVGSKTLLVLPVFQHNGRNMIWSDENIWMRAWSSAKLSSGLVPVEVPIGDLMDISDIDEDQALSYERRKLDNMLGRYDATEATIMIAVPDKTLSYIGNEQETSKGRLRISIYRTDKSKAEHVKDIFLESDGKETVRNIYDRGVFSAYEELQKDWKRKTLSSASQSTEFHVRVPLGNIRQWAFVQKSLINTPRLHNFSVLSMKKNEARLSLEFRGDINALRSALSRSNMSIGQGYTNGSVHKFTDHQRNAPELMYDLSYRGAPKITTNNFYRGTSDNNTEKNGESVNSVRTF